MRALANASTQMAGCLRTTRWLAQMLLFSSWPLALPVRWSFFHSATAGNYDEAAIEACSLATGERRTLLRGGFSPRYLATSGESGHLVYLNGSTLFGTTMAGGSSGAGTVFKLSTNGTGFAVIKDVPKTLVYALARWRNGPVPVFAG